MKDNPKLEDWSAEGRQNLWSAPELQRISIVGRVYGHPDQETFPDGDRICTSYVKNVDGRIITTHSGSTYELGEIAPEYEQWITNQGYTYNYENPIKVHGIRKNEKSN